MPGQGLDSCVDVWFGESVFCNIFAGPGVGLDLALPFPMFFVGFPMTSENL